MNADDVHASCNALDEEDLRLLALVAAGLPAPAVAHRLNTSPRTLQRRIRDVRDRIGVQTTIEAVAWAARRQLI
ncbi:MAG TPA: hypothetical protein VE442_15565 [Jatrophihabitans sp.]|jgi:DNA-binding NarL/FixJ family response regulator|nr:hypothetical protein [Jatrophihabitans sp.]